MDPTGSPLLLPPPARSKRLRVGLGLPPTGALAAPAAALDGAVDAQSCCCAGVTLPLLASSPLLPSPRQLPLASMAEPSGDNADWEAEGEARGDFAAAAAAARMLRSR